VARNLHRTITAEESSIALSPPNARQARLLAFHDANRDGTASAV